MSEMIRSYKDLLVWQHGIELCKLGYAVTESFPKKETFGITLQIRKCLVSIPSNIAEGYMRGHTTEYVQFLRVAYGSGAELDTQLIIALKVGYLTQEHYQQMTTLLNIIMKMLNKLMQSLKLIKT